MLLKEPNVAEKLLISAQLSFQTGIMNFLLDQKLFILKITCLIDYVCLCALAFVWQLCV